MQEFLKELLKLSKKHKVALVGKLKIAEFDGHLPETLNYALPEYVEHGGIIDRSGKYIIGDMDRVPEPVSTFSPIKCKIDIIDYERPMEGGIISPADNKYYSRRSDYEQSLKDKGMHVVTDSRERTAEKRQQIIEQKKQLERDSSNFAWN